MRFSFSDEQQQFRDTVRRFLGDHAPIAAARRAMAATHGYDEATWDALNDKLGVAGVHLETAYGGLGFGAVELGIVLEEMGRSLYCGPYFGSAVMAAGVIQRGASEAHKLALLPAIANGTCVASLAVAEAAGRWDCTGIAMIATASDDGFRLNGEKRFVLDGMRADVLIVAARLPATQGEDGVSLFIVEADSDGLESRALNSLDQTRRLAALKFVDVAATPLNTPGGAGPALTRALDEAAIALASEMVGGAAVLLEQAVDYAATRMQFGRLVGSFQAIKHKCANLLLNVELAKSAAYYAAEAAAGNEAGLGELAALAKATAAEAYLLAARENIQIHGGIGFTWDHDSHLWFRRAKSSEVFLGDPSWHRERYIAALEAAL